MKERDDKSLLRAVATQRDPEALAELFERHRKQAFSIACKILHDSALAEDVVQDAMLSVWLSTESLNPNDPHGWILGIVVKTSLRLGRTQKRSSRREERIAMEQSRLEGAVGEEIEGNELIAILRSHIDLLPDLERTLLVCSYCTNMSHREIAKLVGIPDRTVTNKIRSVLDRLRIELTGAGVAAVMPLLSRENVFEAMTTGHECPPGMAERIMERIKIHERATRFSRRMTPLKTSKVSMLAFVLFLAGGVIAWIAFDSVRPIQSSDVRVNSTPAVAGQASASIVPIDRTWDFNTPELPKDIRVDTGNWHWVSNGGPDKSGCMETNGPVTTVILDVPLARLPVLVSMLVRDVVDSGNGSTMGILHWTADDGIADFHNIAAQPIIQRGQWIECSYFVTEKFIGSVWKSGNQPLRFSYTSRRHDARLALSFAKSAHQVDDLKIREIQSELIPDSSAYVNALEKIEPSKRVGDVPVPELKSARPPKPVTISFYPPSEMGVKP